MNARHALKGVTAQSTSLRTSESPIFLNPDLILCQSLSERSAVFFDLKILSAQPLPGAYSTRILSTCRKGISYKMAMPISAGEIYAIAEKAYKIWKACKAAPSEFQQIGKEVFGTRTIVEVVHIECKDPDSIINQVDKKPEQTIRKQLGVYIRNCEGALKAVEALLKRYKQMGLGDKVKWALSGKEEVSQLAADLSSFASQLDHYVDTVTLKAVGLVNKNLLTGLGGLEVLLEKHAGNTKAAVAELMKQRQTCGASKKDTRRSQTLMEEYAEEISFSAEADISDAGTVRTKTPDPPRDRKPKNDNLTVPKPNRGRAASVDTALKPKGPKNSAKSSDKKKKPNKPNFTLECWLVQIKSAQALFVTFEKSEKERQCRGQGKLREMAKQFNSMPASARLAGDQELVKWVLKDRKKHEEDDKYTWYPHAAKMERKGNALLGLGVEEQAMVIIKRQEKAKPKKDADNKFTKPK